MGSDRFVRASRSILVRRAAIAAIRRTGHGDVLLRTTGGAELRLGRTYLAAFRAMLSPVRDADD